MLLLLTDLQGKSINENTVTRLPYLEAGKVGVLELDTVLVVEVLGHSALDRLARLQLQREPARNRDCLNVAGT